MATVVITDPTRPTAWQAVTTGHTFEVPLSPALEVAHPAEQGQGAHGRGGSLTSHWLRRPVSCRRDQMLWILPACSGWLLVLPQAHWCFSMSVSYTRPAAGRARSPRAGPGLPYRGCTGHPGPSFPPGLLATPWGQWRGVTHAWGARGQWPVLTSRKPESAPTAWPVRLRGQPGTG